MVPQTQEDFENIPASVGLDGLVMSEWQLSTEELNTLVVGGRVRIWQQTDGRTLQPVRMDVTDPTDTWEES